MRPGAALEVGLGHMRIWMRSISGFVFAGCVLAGALAGGGTTSVNAAGRAQSAPPAAAQKALLDRYCVGCHNERTKSGDLSLANANLQALGGNAEVWERVIRKLRAGMMPPAGNPRPDEASYHGLITFLEGEIDRSAMARPNPGRTETLHRLNRAEYRNAVRDVLGLTVDVAHFLPADDASYGFDNMAGALKLNQSNLERYLAAAMEVSRLAVGGAPTAPASVTFPVPVDQPQYDQVEGLPFGTRGGTLIHYNFPRDGEYEITVSLTCTTEVDLECNGSLGWASQHELQILLDSALLKSFTLQPRAVNMGNPNEPTLEGITIKDERWRVRLPVKAGMHEVGATFVKGPAVEYVRSGYRKRFERPFRYYADTQLIAEPFVDKVVIAGPFDVGGTLGLTGETESRRTIFSCKPAAAAEEAPCARAILSKLARRAYRRPVNATDVTELMTFYRQGREDGSFDAGIEMAIRRMLVSTKFLFRMEADPAGAADGTNYRLSDLELASRLSFFLWSSVPDEALLADAVKGQLHTPAVLRRHVSRMLADSRSSALVENFFAQWLKLRHIEQLRPSEALFPDFDAELRAAFRRETELFVDHIIRADRSVLDLLSADYTFLNARLARHYGIQGVGGTDFRKVQYPDDRRRGLLGHGSVLALTSHAIRTSPVFRGKWVLENILATPPPPPPANVPPLQEEELGSRKVMTMREKMAVHRANPVCAACHSMIDPAGFALENFDPVGRWRDHDDAFKPLDTTGVLPDGTKFATLGEFRRALSARPDRFVANLTEKLLGYALGRGIEYYDQPAVRQMVSEASRTQYRFSSLVQAIVSSQPFQMRRVSTAELSASK
jgi:hypothetical protein